ncbi:hypothetical protein [Streptomyces cacaoi]
MRTRKATVVALPGGGAVGNSMAAGSKSVAAARSSTYWQVTYRTRTADEH